MHLKLSSVILFSLVISSFAEDPPTDRVRVVSIHVGDDDQKEDTFVYHPRPGFFVRDIQLHEITKGGDAQYNVTSKTSEEVRVYWHVASHRKRGPFKVVIDTKTAFLTLEMTVFLTKIPPPPDSIWDKLLAAAERLGSRVAVFAFGVAFIITLLVLAAKYPNPTSFQYTVFRIVLALAAAGIGAFLPGFLDVQVSTSIRAGGALAVFIVVYFFSPAQLVAKPK
jgi:hypothetical protein